MSKHKHRDRSWGQAPEPLPFGVIDNHTHLASVVPFAEQMNREALEREQPPVPVYSIDEMLEQAQNVGVTGIIDCACELPRLQDAVDMALTHPHRVWAALAIHPNEAPLHGHRGDMGPDGLPVRYEPHHDVDIDEAISQVANLARQYRDVVVAIGETGLDFFRTGEAALAAQKEAFRAHIAIAKELNLPLQIHDRDAHQDVIDILLHDGAPERTVFHSFSGDAHMAEIAREHGWYLSFSGTVSYKGNDNLRAALRAIDRSHILVETDAPYLTPMPYRGRTNAPYMIPYTLQAMSDTLDESLIVLTQQIQSNTYDVFHIATP